MSGDERLAAERTRRGLALRLCFLLGNTTAMRTRVAQAFDVTERTLRRWAQRAREGAPLAARRGRPPDPVPRTRRQAVIDLLHLKGPRLGVPALRGEFTDVPYRALASLKRRFVRAIQRRRGWYRNRLWATDFTVPEAELPDDADRLCLVRDLASGAQLAATPCRGERAAVVCSVLTALFVALGPPLLLKHDGGGAYRAQTTQALLDDHDVTPLRSPPYTPQYNGSCERSGGTLKQRVAHFAWADGHPGCWTDANLREATHDANHLARPRGPNGPTPAEAFAQRAPIGDEERRAFKQTRACAIAQALQTHESERGTMPSCAKHAAIVRKATQHALCRHGYLEFRRGRISTPFASWKAGTKA
jgi:transposase InsO family protein